MEHRGVIEKLKSCKFLSCGNCLLFYSFFKKFPIRSNSQLPTFFIFVAEPKSNEHSTAQNNIFHPRGGRNISSRGRFTFLMLSECSGEDGCGLWSKRNRALIWFCRHILNQGLQTVLSEGHISYCTTVRGADILRNVILSGYVTFHEINIFSYIYYVFIIDKMSSRAEWNGYAGRIWSAGGSLETPALNWKQF